jgi:tetratricopeptide (TPR) repeat protein
MSGRPTRRKLTAAAMATWAMALAWCWPEPARASVPEIPDVPQELPDAFAVMPFENQSGVRGLDWMSAAVAFTLGEKLEAHPKLLAAHGPLVVPEERAPTPADERSVAAYALETGARWVWTGVVDRPNWKLQVEVSLWRVDPDRRGGRNVKVSRVGEVVRRGDFQELHTFLGDALVELCRAAELPLSARQVREAYRLPTRDFYAFTLFGRGLTALTGTAGAIDLEAAHRNLTRSVFIDPRLVEAHRLLGDVEVRQGELSRARNRYSRALEQREDYVAALVGMGVIEYQRGRPEQAIELLSSALAQRPDHFEARYHLGLLLWEAGRLDRAFHHVSQVVSHRPQHVRARRVLVLIHASRGDGQDLVRELEIVLELDPDDEQTRLDLAAAYASIGRDDAALGVYRTILAENPEHLQALKFLGDIHRRRGELDEAIESYQRAHELDDSDPRPYFLLGATYVAAGHDDEAERIYQQAARRFVRYRAEVHNNLGAIAYRQGDLAASARYLERAVSENPTRSRYRYNYALTLSKSGRRNDALAQLDAGLDLDPNNAELHYLRGVVLLREGRAGEATDAFERAVSIDPEHDDARHNLARLRELERRAREGEVVLD